LRIGAEIGESRDEDVKRRSRARRRRRSRFRLTDVDLMWPSRRHASGLAAASAFCSGFVARAAFFDRVTGGGRRLDRRDAFFPVREIATQRYAVGRSALVEGPVERHDVAALVKTHE
jgi:hypothetical protein